SVVPCYQLWLNVVTTASMLCSTVCIFLFTPFTHFFVEASLVTPSQLKAMLSNRSVQLFDVRNPDEYQDGHIPQAINLPLNIVEESLKLPPESFKQKFEVKAPGKDDDNIVFNCRTGVRSGEALGIARQMGFHRARHLKGGYVAWVEQEGN
uniref:Thiosulfate sulfurtransferase/rhodanese-like domain-containing protein 1 n=1 Tax=Poecilia reticulata TaxID=8081 RepID=A0A3P9Q0L8_POERE